MGQISDNLFMESRKRACIARNVEKISSEVMEELADESVFKANRALFEDNDIDIKFDDRFVTSLENEFPDTEDAIDSIDEINRIIASDDDVDIDDILGVDPD